MSASELRPRGAQITRRLFMIRFESRNRYRYPLLNWEGVSREPVDSDPTSVRSNRTLASLKPAPASSGIHSLKNALRERRVSARSRCKDDIKTAAKQQQNNNAEDQPATDGQSSS